MRAKPKLLLLLDDHPLLLLSIALIKNTFLSKYLVSFLYIIQQPNSFLNVKYFVLVKKDLTRLKFILKVKNTTLSICVVLKAPTK